MQVPGIRRFIGAQRPAGGGTPSIADGQRRAWRRFVGALVLALVALVAIVLYIQPVNRAVDYLTLRHLQTPTFEPAPPAQPVGTTLAHVWTDLRSQAGIRFLHDLLPTQGGVLWIAVLVALVVAFDFQDIRNPRNLELASLLVVGFLMFDILRFFDLLTDPTYFQVMDWVFTGIVAASLWLAARAAWRLRHPYRTPWTPNLPARALVVLTIVLLSLNAMITVVREPDDAGFYTNLGGQRLRERGMFSYGDPMLTGSPAAAYGPVLFLAHVPFQLLFDPHPANPPKPPDPVRSGLFYRLPPLQASQLATLAFHLMGVTALVLAVRRLAGARVAWGVAALYCGSAYVLGVGGARESIGGLTFISHTAAPALTLAAVACLASPLAAGALLALGVATVFYPLFFVPAWLGYFSRDRSTALRFLGGIALAAIVVGGPVLARSRAIDGHSLIGTVVRETLGHHQSSEAYGTTPFGFWGQREGVRGWLQRELVHGQAVTTPMFLLVAGLAILAFFPARRATPQQLALLSAALAVLVDVWKILGTGVYVTWYYPLLLIGFFAYGDQAREEPVTPGDAATRLERHHA